MPQCQSNYQRRQRIKHLLMVVMAATCLLAVHGKAQAEEANVNARMSDGKRIDGKKLHDWSDNDGHPKIDNKSLFTKDRLPLLIRRRGRQATLKPPYVRMKNGDVIPGRLAGLDQSANQGTARHRLRLRLTPGHALRGDQRPLSVCPDDIEAVVRTAAARRQLKPGTVILADGRHFQPQALRWTSSGLRLLLDNQMLNVPMRELAGLRVKESATAKRLTRQATMPGVSDDAYVGRILTEHGALLSFWSDEIRADDDKQLVQPAWASSPILIPQDQIIAWSYHKREKLPLSLLPATSQSSGQGSGFHWPWRVNRNVRGQLAQVGKRSAVLALGTHAPLELRFKLPPASQAFTGWVGIDQAVQDGGCAVASVYAGPAKGKPDWTSDVITGAEQAKKIDRIKLDNSAKSLTLDVDQAADDRPDGADPLSIRDEVSWLRPMIEVKLTDQPLKRKLTAVGLPMDAWSIAANPSETANDNDHKDDHENDDKKDDKKDDQKDKATNSKKDAAGPAKPPTDLTFDRWFAKNNDHCWWTGVELGDEGLTVGRTVRVTDKHMLVLARLQTGPGKRRTEVHLRATPINGDDEALSFDGSTGERSIESHRLLLKPLEGKKVRLTCRINYQNNASDHPTPVRLARLRLVPIVRGSGGSPPRPDVSLWSLKPTKITHKHKKHFSLPEDAGKQSVTWLGRTFKTGFKVQDGLSLTVPIKPGYRRFVAVVAHAGKGTVKATQINIDGQQVYRMPTNLDGPRPRQIDLPIGAGAQTLTLISDGNADGILGIARAGFITSDHSDRKRQ